MIIRKPKKKIPLLALSLFAFILLGIFADYAFYRNKLYPGIQVKNISLGSMSPDDVKSTLSQAEFTFSGLEGESISFSLAEMGISLDSTYIFEAAYQQGRQDPWPFTYSRRIKLKKEGVVLPLRYQIDEEGLAKSVDRLAKHFDREPKNAYFSMLDDGNAEIVPERYGYQVDKEMLEKELVRSIYNPHTPLIIAVPFTEKLPPEITIASLKEKDIESLMSSFHTPFNIEAQNRTHNIRLAADTLNNYILQPGSIISLNAVIGETTSQKGYKEAPIIMGTKLVPGLGGGLCQVSTTLYNAALLANLEIVERNNHKLTVPYIHPGQDATISYPYLDLKIRNNKDHHILISSAIDKNELTFTLFGQPLQERVEIEPKILATYPPPVEYEFDPNLAPGSEEVEEGKPGYSVEVWKRVYVGDDLEKEGIISVNTYLPYPQIIKRGPAVD